MLGLHVIEFVRVQVPLFFVGLICRASGNDLAVVLDGFEDLVHREIFLPYPAERRRRMKRMRPAGASSRFRTSIIAGCGEMKRSQDEA